MLAPWEVRAGRWQDYPDALEAADVLLTDPPYGIAYRSGMTAPNRWSGTVARSIVGDEDTQERDTLLAAWGDRPALVFGTWRIPRPVATRALLVWDSKGALGMGDLSLPWKPAHQEVYVLGRGFVGRRGSDVLRFAPVQAMAKNGRVHPHQKPVDLLVSLLDHCPRHWVVLDPFCGSGSTGVACQRTGHRFIGIECQPEYVAIARARIAAEADAPRLALLTHDAPAGQ